MTNNHTHDMRQTINLLESSEVSQFGPSDAMINNIRKSLKSWEEPLAKLHKITAPDSLWKKNLPQSQAIDDMHMAVEELTDHMNSLLRDLTDIENDRAGDI